MRTNESWEKEMLINDIARRNIKKYRKMRKMSQKDLAEALDVTHSSVSAWEMGKNSIDINRLEQISTVLKVPLCEIIFEGKHYANVEIDKETEELLESLKKRPKIMEIMYVCLGSKDKDIIMATKLLEHLIEREGD